jgi:hypothetical protein
MNTAPTPPLPPQGGRGRRASRIARRVRGAASELSLLNLAVPFRFVVLSMLTCSVALAADLETIKPPEGLHSQPQNPSISSRTANNLSTAFIKVKAWPEVIDVKVAKAPLLDSGTVPHRSRWCGKFILNVEVKNDGDRAEGFDSADCGWEANWSTSQSDVVFAEETQCLQNLYRMIALAPGESYRRELPLRVCSKADSGTSVFQVAFASMGLPKDKRVTPDSKTPNVYWSDPIRLNLTPASPQGRKTVGAHE